VDTELPDAVPMLQADHDRLLQVMLNLLSNAAKFLPPGSGWVRVGLRVEPGCIRVEVSDNGPGVPAGMEGVIFQKFRQGGDEHSRPQGTGLGLPISRQIVEHYGGCLWLEPGQPGSGATFAFTLPLPSVSAA
jgi:signal transduction histidine kinase